MNVLKRYHFNQRFICHYLSHFAMKTLYTRVPKELINFIKVKKYGNYFMFYNFKNKNLVLTYDVKLKSHSYS